jgi:endonuclease/exonuclease/phosphatase (EEP) superfamily protein YafD
MAAKRLSAGLEKLLRRLALRGWRAIPAVAGAGYLALVGLWWLLGALSGDSIGFVRLANYVTPWIGLSLLPVLLVAGLLRRPVLGGATFLLVLLVLAPYGGQIGRGLTGIVSGGASVPPDAVHVMSYNVMGRNWEVGSISAVILRQHPDVLLLQEVRQPEELLDRLNGLYPDALVNVVRDDRLKLMIVSRFPLRAGEWDRDFQRASVQLPTGTVELRNLHAIRGVRDDGAQLAFVDKLLGDIEDVEGPLLVAGDFNMTQANEGYRRMKDSLRSTQEEAGRWFGFTFATPQRRLGILMPFIRIDHIFVGGGIEVLRAGRLSDFGNSDHFPIDAILRLDGPGVRGDAP